MGCPALQAGRYVSGLAGLLGPSATKGGFGLALRATPAHRSSAHLLPHFYGLSFGT